MANSMNKILAFGDSVLKGIVIKDGRYVVSPDKFTALTELRTGLQIENKGHMGHTIMQFERVINRCEETFHDPSFDCILLEYGGNDCDFNWKEVAAAPEQSHLSKVPRDFFISEYIRHIEFLKSLDKKVLLLSLPPIDGERYFQWFSKTLDGEHVLQWLHNDTSFLTHWHESYNLAVYRVGAITQTPVIDITTPFLEKRNFSDYLCEDGIHPNELGHKLIADVLIPLLTKEREG